MEAFPNYEDQIAEERISRWRVFLREVVSVEDLFPAEGGEEAGVREPRRPYPKAPLAGAVVLQEIGDN